MLENEKKRYDPTTKITLETGEAILKAYLTESPRPSHRVLAERFGLSRAAVQRYVAKHEHAIERATEQLSRTEQPSESFEKAVTTEIVVKALPKAQARINEITKDLATEKMRMVLSEAEDQYIALKEENPHLAGAYLREMRQTLEGMGNWIGIEKTMQDATPIMINGKSVERRCADCPYRERFTREELRKYLKGEETKENDTG